jgi:hypothetical protein
MLTWLAFDIQFVHWFNLLVAGQICIEIFGALSSNSHRWWIVYFRINRERVVCGFVPHYKRWRVVIDMLCLGVVGILEGFLGNGYVLEALNTWYPVEWIFARWSWLLISFLTDFVKYVAYGTTKCKMVLRESNFFNLDFILKSINFNFEFALGITLI